MITFKFTAEIENKTVEVKFEAVTIDEILEEVEFFLAGCGYHLKGRIEVYEEEEA